MHNSRWLRRIGALVTSLFTVYLLLDTFVIEKSYASAAEAESAISIDVQSEREREEKNDAPALSDSLGTTASAAFTPPADATIIGSYETEELAITLYTFRAYDTQIYAADLSLNSVQTLRTAFADGVYGRNITATTSSIAAGSGALLAINGDFCGAREDGLVIRNGVLYRDGGGQNREALVVYSDGSFEIISCGEKSGAELIASGAWQAFSFGPGLVEGGNVIVSGSDEVSRAKGSNPRTAIGMIEAGHYVFLVSDGRTNTSEGLSLAQLGEIMASLGCESAYNLDGGGSSTMVFLGEVVNNPTTNGKRISERSVSDIVYV